MRYPRWVGRVGIAAVLALATSACSLQYSVNRYSDFRLPDARTPVALEGGLTLERWELDGSKVDLGIAASVQTFDFPRDAAASHVGLRARYFPMPDASWQPFAAAGLGGYTIRPIEDASVNCNGSAICYGPTPSHSRSPASGISPHLTLGVERPIGEGPYSVLFSVTRELLTQASDWELDSWRVSFGLRWDPEGD